MSFKEMEQTRTNEIIKFEVLGDQESNGNHFYIINYEGKECWVKKHPSQVNNESNPKFIECNFIGNDYWGRPRFVQNRASIISTIYEEDVEYPFTVERKEKDVNSGADYYVLVDKYHDSYRLYKFDLNELPDVNSEVKCIFKIDIQKGRFTLTQASIMSKSKFKERKWFEPQTVFDEIGETSSFENLFNCYVTSEDENLTKQQYELINNLAIKHNNWVFSYLNFIDQVLVNKFVEDKDYDLLEIYTDISLKFQYWLLEGSDFLSCYHHSVKEDTILRSKRQIAKYEAQMDAINILREGGQTEFIDNLLKKLRASGRLVYKKQEYIETLIKLLFIDSNTIQSKISELTELFYLLTTNETIEDYHKGIIIRYLDRKINVENNQLNKLLHFSLNNIEQDEYKHRIETIIQIIVTQILLEDKSSINIRRRKSQFYRFISYLSNGDDVLFLVNLSLDSLTGRINDDNIFGWDNIINFNIENIKNKVKSIRRVITNTRHTDKYYYRNKKGVVIVDSNISILSMPEADKVNLNPFKFTQLHSLMNGRLIVDTLDRMIRWERSNDFSMIKTQWDTYYAETSKRNWGPRFDIDDVIFVEVKAFQKNEKLIFVKILSEPQCNKDAAIYAGDICDQWIDDTSQLCDGGEILRAKIKYIDDNGKIGLSIREFTGYFESENNDARDIFQSYAEQCRLQYEESTQTNIDQDYELNSLDKNFCEEIVYVIDSLIKLEKDPVARFELLHFAQLTSLLIGDINSLYYRHYIMYLMSIDSFTKSESGYISEDNAPNKDVAFTQFADLQEKQTIVDVLKEYSKPNITPRLMDLTKSDNESVAPKDEMVTNLAKAILADKILKEIDTNELTKHSVKKLINTMVSGSTNEPLTPLLTELNEGNNRDTGGSNEIDGTDNLGRESLHTEFKTSFVYSTLSNEYNIEEQSAIIMRTIAGFLNASGGVLYIGIDDTGAVRGIKNDLDITGDDLDKYQRRIQQCIVDSFNKDINSTIRIIYKNYNSKIVCIITIPKYHQPVAYRNEFWQRQGNETRIIKGADLVPFIIRQTNNTSTNISSYIAENQIDNPGITANG